ncbi:hypothetical protein PWW31_08965 [Vibrio harveyi]|nr:hypothetical protein PWW31_08965 [Vibrio harveyi]
MSKRLAMPNEGREVTKTPGHWVLAQLGKKVLRPGGKELTQKMLQGLAITRDDRVVEFAPEYGLYGTFVLGKIPCKLHRYRTK